MKNLKPWHTLVLGALIGYAVARRAPGIKIPVIG